MKGLDKLNDHLALFEKKRKDCKTAFNGDREEYAKEIARWFLPCAQWILDGHFVVKNSVANLTVVREIHPTALELYYHEEATDGFKDPIMYHTDDRKKQDHLRYPWHEDYFEARGIQTLPYFPFGSLNPHPSGIDVTFENPTKRYRASFLIREYIVKYEGENGKIKTVVNSTEIYDDMLISGIPQNNNDWLEWVDGTRLAIEEIEQRGRRNVAEYVPDYSVPGLWNKNTEIEGRDSFKLGKDRFVKCPFQWQFRRKQ